LKQVGGIIVITALELGFNLIADGLNRGLLRRHESSRTP
jgi:hypothetical protein